MNARTIHSIARDMGVEPELVGMLIKEHHPKTRVEVEALVTAWVLNERAKDDAEAAAASKSEGRKPGLTLSQRRALVKLQASPQNPPSAFRALPFDYLVECGYATRLESGAFVLTGDGASRAATINPLYVRWSAGETVAGDPNRPPAGTHRATATVLL